MTARFSTYATLSFFSMALRTSGDVSPPSRCARSSMSSRSTFINLAGFKSASMDAPLLISATSAAMRCTRGSSLMVTWSSSARRAVFRAQRRGGATKACAQATSRAQVLARLIVKACVP